MTAKPAREQIIEAAKAHGWETDRGYRTDAEKSAAWVGLKGERGVHVEFSATGGITYASTSTDVPGRRWDVLRGSRRLSRVLEFVRETA